MYESDSYRNRSRYFVVISKVCRGKMEKDTDFDGNGLTDVLSLLGDAGNE